MPQSDISVFAEYGTAFCCFTGMENDADDFIDILQQTFEETTQLKSL